MRVKSKPAKKLFFNFLSPRRGARPRRPKEENTMATFFKGRTKFEAEFFFHEWNESYYILLDKAVAAKLLLFYEIVWETWNSPDEYGHRPCLSMDAKVDKCLIGVHWDDGELRLWNSSLHRDDKRVSYNTFMSAEEGHLGEIIDIIFDAIDYFCGIDDESILGRFAPEYVLKFIEGYLWWYIPNKARDVFEFTARDLIALGVKPGREPEDE